MKKRHRYLRRVYLPVLSGWLLWASGAIAQTPADECSDICSGLVSPCTVGAAYDVVDGSVLNCSNIDLTVGVAGNLKVTDGSYTLKAKSLTVANSGILKAVDGDDATGSLAIDVVVQNNVTLRGTFNANAGDTAGSISIEAGGNITLEEVGGGIEAYGTEGGDGGEINLDAGGNVEIHSHLQVSGAGAPGTIGGDIEIKAGGNITVYSSISAAGYQGGEGGTATLRAGGTISFVSGGVDATGNGATSAGGGIELQADTVAIDGETLTVRGGVNATGSDAVGGSISIRAKTVQLINSAVLDARGAAGSGLDGGAIDIEADQTVSVMSSSSLQSAATAGNGLGGDIKVRAPLVSLGSGTLVDAGGGSTSGAGGSITIQGCDIDVGGTSQVRATAFRGGRVSLSAVGGLTNPNAPTDKTRLYVSEFSNVRAAGGSGGQSGRIELSVQYLTPGECSNNHTVHCELDTSCTAGCETGDCDGSTQDTDGVYSQFDVSPVRYLARGVGNCAY